MSKSKVRIPVLHEGTLSKYGYSLSKTRTGRRKALKHAVDKYGYSKVMKKVNLLYIYNMNKHPSIAKKVQGDKKFLMEHYALVRRRSPLRKSRKTRKVRKTRRMRSRMTRKVRKTRRTRSRKLRMSAKW